MITRYPVLEFFSKVVGIYKTSDGEFVLELRKNGYGFVLLSNDNAKRSHIYGVIGVSGGNLELHASMGLPNILLFVWPHALEEINPNQEICLREASDNLSITFIFSVGSLIMKLTADDKKISEYVLQKA